MIHFFFFLLELPTHKNAFSYVQDETEISVK